MIFRRLSALSIATVAVCCLLYALPLYGENSEAQQKAFVKAMLNLDIDGIKTLADNDYDFKEPVDPQLTPTFLDIFFVISSRLKKGADGDLFPTGIDEPFDQKATDERLAKLITVLARNGFDVGKTNTSGESALHYVVRMPYLEKTCEALIKVGLDVNQGNGVGNAPIFHIRPGEPFNPKIAKMLLKGYKTVEGAESPLERPVYWNDFTIVRFLIANGLPVNPGSPSNHIPLFSARTAEMAELLIKHGASPKATDTAGNTVIHRLVSFGCLCQATSITDFQKMLNLYKKHGVDLNAPNKTGVTPIKILEKTLERHQTHSKGVATKDYQSYIQVFKASADI